MTDENENPNENQNESPNEDPQPDPNEDKGNQEDGGDQDNKGKEGDGEDGKEDQFDASKVTPESRFQEEEEEDGGGDDDGIDPDDKATIGKIVDKRVGKLDRRIQAQQDEIDVNTYILENPQMAKYKPGILKYVKHSAYRNVPIKNIAAIVAAGDMQKLGAEKEREAQEQANNTKNDGRQTRSKVTGGTDWKNASKDAFNKKYAQVMGQTR